jgi:hypothetical protein
LPPLLPSFRKKSSASGGSFFFATPTAYRVFR